MLSLALSDFTGGSTGYLREWALGSSNTLSEDVDSLTKTSFLQTVN